MKWVIAEVDDAFVAIDAAMPRARQGLADLLNGYHGTQRGVRYYDIVCGYWLLVFVHATYACWWEHRGRPMARAGVGSIPVFADQQALIDLAAAGELSDVLAAAHGAPDLGQLEFAASEARIVTGAGRRKLPILRSLLSAAGAEGKVLVCDPYAKCSRIEWAAFLLLNRDMFKWNDLACPFDHTVGIDREWRIAAARVAGDGKDFESMLGKLLPLFLPAAFLEGYERLRKQVLDILPIPPKVFYTATGWYVHMPLKILAAENHKRALLAGHQHGGNYGFDRRHAAEEYERSICDVFFTWGWGEGEAGLLPLSPPVFRRPQRARRYRLTVSLNFYARGVHRIEYFPKGETAQDADRQVIDLCTRLAQTCAAGMLIRPHPSPAGSEFVYAIRKALPAVAIDDFAAGSIERFLESDLVIHTYLATGWLETLWLDVPALALYDSEVYAFREQADHYVEAFKRFGMLHTSAESLADHYLSVRDDIAGWWQQPDFAALRKRFVRDYVRVDSGWRGQWREAFSQLLGRAPA